MRRDFPTERARRRVREFAKVWPVLASAIACWLAMPAFQIAHVPALCFGAYDLPTRAATYFAIFISPAFGLALFEHWAVMTGAMMLPLLVPAARHVRARSFKGRWLRSQIYLISGFWLIWSLMGIAAFTLILTGVVWEGTRGVLLAAVALGAILWQLSEARASALRRCTIGAALRPAGFAADWDCMRYGAKQALACARTCLPAMCAMSLSPTGHLAALPMTWLLLRERHRRPGGGWAVAGLVALVSAGALLPA